MRSIACAMTLMGARHWAPYMRRRQDQPYIHFDRFSHYQMYRAQVEEGHNECLEVLVAAGADLNARFYFVISDYRPLQYALSPHLELKTTHPNPE